MARPGAQSRHASLLRIQRLPAAYTLAHVKLRQLLDETGVALKDADRLPVFLADTMVNSAPKQGTIPGADI